MPANKILIVEDDVAIRDLLMKFLTQQGFLPKWADNGLQAQQLLVLEDYDAVISDINMPGSGINGLNLLQYLKKHFSMPVILMTGFASIGNTKDAHDLGADAFLAKPFKRAELLTTLRRCLDLPECVEPTPAPPHAPETYRPLSISDFLSGKTIRHSIYIQLSPDKYVKIAHQGEDLPLEQIEKYKRNGIKQLFLLTEDFINYVKSSLTITKAACESKSITSAKKLGVVKHVAEVIMESLSHHPIASDRLNEAKSLVEIAVDFLSESDDALGLLSSLIHSSNHLYAHSIGVSFYASLIAKELGWNSNSTLNKVALAGLLHEIGYKEIDPSILDKTRAQMTLDEIRILESHPLRGAKILSAIASIPAEVLQVVLQHHERDCGFGFPSGLSRSKIHPLAKVVAVADEFCDIAIPRPGEFATPPAEALMRLTLLQGAVLDPDALRALTTILSKSPLRNQAA